MKHVLLVIFSLCLFQTKLNSQNFTWVKGNTFNGIGTGTYGTIGIPSLTNNPGHRHGCATWTDNSGNLWLFGGEGYGTSSTLGWLNDIWKFNPSTNEWTWLKGSTVINAPGVYGPQGVPNASNTPGAREFSQFWKDAQGNFWMHGGDGYDANGNFGRLGDMWRYNPLTNEWTFITGFTTLDNNGIYGTLNTPNATNKPGARYGAANWTDAAGNLWLFGGRGYAATGSNTHLNDLWRYTISTNQWTWMGGSNAPGQNGIFGTLGVPSTSNIPGGLEFPACWVGTNNMVYLFAGRGYVSAGSAGYTNNLWRYNPTTNEWTWLKGSNALNSTGSYGTFGQGSPAVQPGGRYAMGFWKDGAGDFWLFGGLGWASSSIGVLNDVFKYTVATNEFTWMKGAQNPGQPGSYGTQNTAAPSNMPGGRYFNNSWTINNILWLFGGEGTGSIAPSLSENMNDVWKFKVPCNPDSMIATPTQTYCSGNVVNLSAQFPYPSTYQWYSSITGTQVIGSGANYTFTAPTAVSGSSVFTYYSQANNCTLTPNTAMNITVVALPAISVSGNTLICVNGASSLTASGASSYSWSNGSTNTSVVVTPTTTTAYTVTGISANGCQNNAVASVSVQLCLGLNETNTVVNDMDIYPNPNNGTFELKLKNVNEKNVFLIKDVQGRLIHKVEITDMLTPISLQLSSGYYLAEYWNSHSIMSRKKIMVY